MSRDPLVAELVEQLVAARFAELVRENRALRARLAAEPMRGRPAAPVPAPAPLRPASELLARAPAARRHPSSRPQRRLRAAGRPLLRLVPAGADGART